MSAPAGIDPRGPVFAARITSALLLVATVLGLVSGPPRAEDLSFGWSAYKPLADEAFVPGGS